MSELKGSLYAEDFAFLLRCRKCGNVLRELGGNAYEAEQALQQVRASDEVCPVCRAKDWGKLRRIIKKEVSE